MSLRYLLALTLLCTPLAWGYNTGAREDSCYAMQVEHTTIVFPIGNVLVPAVRCGSSCDFSLTMVGKVDYYDNRTLLEENSTTYECGEVYELLLASSRIGASLEGWLLEARETDPATETFSNTTSMWGEWLFENGTDPYHTITCNRSMSSDEVVENAAATHNLRQELQNFSLYWSAPPVPTNESELENLPGNITFWVTVVQQRLLFYFPIPGPTLSRDCAVPVSMSPTPTPMTPPTRQVSVQPSRTVGPLATESLGPGPTETPGGTMATESQGPEPTETPSDGTVATSSDHATATAVSSFSVLLLALLMAVFMM